MPTALPDFLSKRRPLSSWRAHEIVHPCALLQTPKGLPHFGTTSLGPLGFLGMPLHVRRGSSIPPLAHHSTHNATGQTLALCFGSRLLPSGRPAVAAHGGGEGARTQPAPRVGAGRARRGLEPATSPAARSRRVPGRSSSSCRVQTRTASKSGRGAPAESIQELGVCFQRRMTSFPHCSNGIKYGQLQGLRASDALVLMTKGTKGLALMRLFFFGV